MKVLATLLTLGAVVYTSLAKPELPIVENMQSDVISELNQEMKTLKDFAFFYLGLYEHHDPVDGKLLYQKRYYLSQKIKGDWITAFSFCRTMEMELATLESADANANFFELLMKNILRFDEPIAYMGAMTGIGGSRDDWYWISHGRGEKTNFEIPWSKGEPSNADNYEYCLEVSGRSGTLGFNDAPCNHPTAQLHFICQEIFKKESSV